jgi:hypothetical protein
MLRRTALKLFGLPVFVSPAVAQDVAVLSTAHQMRDACGRELVATEDPFTIDCSGSHVAMNSVIPCCPACLLPLIDPRDRLARAATPMAAVTVGCSCGAKVRTRFYELQRSS